MTAADRNTTADALEAMADKDVSDYDVMQLGRIQPEPYRTQMLSLARNMSEARPLMRRAARLLRTPDTPTDSKPRYTPCPKCNDEGVVCSHDGEILGPCDCTELPVGDTAARARALLDNATPGPWGPTCYRGTGLGWDVDGPEAGIRGQFENEADAALIAAAPTLITDLLAERDAAVARADKLEAAIGIGDGIEWSVSLTVLRELAVRYPSWASDLTICEGLLRRIELAANDAAADRGTDR